MRTMILVFVAALAVFCGADKLDKVLFPPVSAKSSGGDAESLQTPLFRAFNNGPENLPSGGYTNEFQGVIVDAANSGSRISGVEQTGLGGPRSSYGSTNSKVGDAAFTSVSGFSSTDGVASIRIAPGFESFVTSEDGKVAHELRVAPGVSESNTFNFNDNVQLDKHSHGYETNSEIAGGENGKVADGMKAQEGYAPETEKNANKEIAGVVDDGLYDKQKYNEGGDYSESNNGNIYNHRQSIVHTNESASVSFTQNDQSSFGVLGSADQSTLVNLPNQSINMGSQSQQKPIYNQKQEADLSYYYNQPSIPFIIPTKPTGVFSPFGSEPSVIQSTTTGTQPSHLEKRPFTQTQSKPTSSFTQTTLGNTVSPTQEYVGTIYEYNKPSEILPPPSSERDKPSEVSSSEAFGSQFPQESTRFGNHFFKPINSTFSQQKEPLVTYFNSQTTGMKFIQKPIISTTQFVAQQFNNLQSSGNIQQNPTGYDTGFLFDQKPQFSSKPFSNSQNVGFILQQNQSNASQFKQQSQTILGSSLTSKKYSQAAQTTQFGLKPFGNFQTIYSNTRQSQPGTTSTGLTSGTQNDLKPQKTFTISATVSPDKYSPLNTFDLSGSQTGESKFQQTKYGFLTDFQFDQKPSSFGIQNTDTQVTHKPFSSSLFGGSDFQNSQFGTRFEAQFSQKPIDSLGTTIISDKKSQYGSKFTTKFGQRPFGNSEYQNGQNLQVNQGSGFISNISKNQPEFNIKPFTTSQSPSSGSHLSRFNATIGSVFGQKLTNKDPGSSFSISAVSSQPDKKSFSSLQTDSSQKGQYGLFSETNVFPFPQNQASIAGFQSSKESQTSPGTSLNFNIFTKNQNLQSNQFDQKHFDYPKNSLQLTGGGISSFQQSQFSFLPESQFRKKSQSNYQQGQLGTTLGSAFDQKPQKTSFGSSFSIGTSSRDQSIQTTDKPLVSTDFQQNQFNTFSSISKNQPEHINKCKCDQKSFQNEYFTTRIPKPQLQGSTLSISSISSQNINKPIGSTQTSSSFYPMNNDQTTESVFSNKAEFGSQTQKPFSTDFNQNEYNSTTSQYGQKPQATVSAFTSTGETDSRFGSLQPNKGSMIVQTRDRAQNVQQSQFVQNTTMVGQVLLTNKESKISNDVEPNDLKGQKLLESTSLSQNDSAFQIQFPQPLDQTTQSNLSSLQVTGSPVQSTSLVDITSQPENFFNSEVEAKTSKPIASTLVSTSQVDIDSQTLKPFETSSTQSSSSQSVLETTQFIFRKYPGQPVGNSLSLTTLPIPVIIYGSDSPYELSTKSNFVKSTTTASSNSGFGNQSMENTTQTTQSSEFSSQSFDIKPTLESKPEVTTRVQVDTPTEQAMTDVVDRFGENRESIPDDTPTVSAVTKVVERFEENRETPKFDDKTGYHY